MTSLAPAREHAANCGARGIVLARLSDKISQQNKQDDACHNPPFSHGNTSPQKALLGCYNFGVTRARAFPANEIRNEQQDNDGCGENEISFHHGVAR